MTDIQFRIERDKSSGHGHKRYADESGDFHLTDERCNRDVSGGFDVVHSTADIDEANLCKICFKQVLAI